LDGGRGISAAGTKTELCVAQSLRLAIRLYVTNYRYIASRCGVIVQRSPTSVAPSNDDVGPVELSINLFIDRCSSNIPFVVDTLYGVKKIMAINIKVN
jgi:hypothetical protein